MAEFKSLPPNDDDNHTIEIRSDGPGLIEVFLDGMEVKGLTHISIEAEPNMVHPEVTLRFYGKSVELDGKMVRHEEETYMPYRGGVAADLPRDDKGDVTIMPWSHPDSDPIADIEAAKKKYEEEAGVAPDRRTCAICYGTGKIYKLGDERDEGSTCGYCMGAGSVI